MVKMKRNITNLYLYFRFYLSNINKGIFITCTISLFCVFILNCSSLELQDKKIIENILFSIIAASIFHIFFIDFKRSKQFQNHLVYVRNKICLLCDMINMFCTSINRDVEKGYILNQQLNWDEYSSFEKSCKDKKYGDYFNMPKYGIFKSYREMTTFLYKNFREIRDDIFIISNFVDDNIIYYMNEIDGLIDTFIHQRMKYDFIDGNFDGLAKSLWELYVLNQKLLVYIDKYSKFTFAIAGKRLDKLGIRWKP